MPGPYILAIDQGTTSSRALIVDAGGAVVGVGQQAFAQHFPQPGWVEHDAEEIWRSTQQAISGALDDAGIGPRELSAIGIANQRETVVVWDRATGAPVAPAIVWQDRRTAGLCGELKEQGLEPAFAQATGLTLDPYFSGTKLTWMFRNNADFRKRADAGDLAAGTVDSWLVWKLTDGERHVTDYTNASRTLLFNIVKGRWDEYLCETLEVPRGILPKPQPSQSTFGRTSEAVFGAEVPITGVAGDQQAALVGQACLQPGQAKNTYGTGCFLLAPAGAKPRPSQNRLLLSLSAAAGPKGPDYVLEGSVFVAGALIQWIRDELGLIRESSDIEALAASVPGSGGVQIVPAFTGLGAPDWDPSARGAILGLTRGTGKAQIARAALEAISLSSAELVLCMNADLPSPITELRVDGGAARNDLLMQIQADMCGIPVVRPANIETTALGAAYLAGLGAGIWANQDEVASLWTAGRTFEPTTTGDERVERMRNWRRGVERTLAWAVAE